MNKFDKQTFLNVRH